MILKDVKELVQECVGGAELQQQKAQIQTFTEQTSSALKKHVYANYMQFIETAKEISRMSYHKSRLTVNRFLIYFLFILQIWNQKCINCHIY